MLSEANADRAGLSALLTPYSLEQFFAEHYERRPLLVSRDGDGRRYEPYFSMAEAQRLLYTTQMRTSDLRVAREGAIVRTGSYTVEDPKKDEKAPPSDLIDPDRASALFAGGCSLVFESVHKYSQPVAALTRRLEMLFRCHVQANVYLTPPENQGFSVHYDTHDTIILQIHGTKHWKIYDAPVELPLKDQHFDKKVHPVGPVQIETDFKPGDLLYIPRGFLHEAKANGELSLHVTIGIFQPLWAQVARNVIGHAAHADAAFRRGAEAEDAARICERIQALFTPEHLVAALERLRSEWLRGRRNNLDGQIDQIAMLPQLNEHSTIAKRSDVLWEMEEEERGAKLTFSGKTLFLPRSGASIIRELDNAGPATVESLSKHDPNALKIVRRLIQEGFALQLEPAEAQPEVA